MIVAKTSLGYFTQSADLLPSRSSTGIHDSWLQASRFPSEESALRSLDQDGYAHLPVAFEDADTYPAATAGHWPKLNAKGPANESTARHNMAQRA